MNKQMYKLVFNRVRNQIMAVAETAVSHGKDPRHGGGTACGRVHCFGLPLFSFSLMLALGLATILPAAADGIVADPAAPAGQQPAISHTSNGLPQVNIQTPTAGGVSVNQYRQFDIGERGAILNNSRGASRTQLGGWVAGNPMLMGGEARIIVNQVNSNNPSLLNGYIEVAGRRAEVVVANPAGIQVNGGGFINASGVTLTTGRPLISPEGYLNGFQVRSGSIQVAGNGLDTATADYTRILTQAAQINAGLWAKNLVVVAGNHDTAADGSYTAVAGSSTPGAVAIDTGNLGGMYAGKISLVSTERGVGINNAGQLFAGVGGVSLSAEGKISNSGSIVAAERQAARADTVAVHIQADHLENSGTVSAQGHALLRTRTVDNSGLLVSAAEMNIRNQEQLTNSGTLNAGRFDIETARLHNQNGNISQTGLQALKIDTPHLSNRNQGLIGHAPLEQNNGQPGQQPQPAPAPTVAAGNGSTAAAPVPSVLPAFADGNIQVTGHLDNDGGKITANGTTELSVGRQLDNQAKLHVGRLTANGQEVDNRQGSILANRVEIGAQNLDNRQGSLVATEQAAIRSRTIQNQQGKVASAKDLQLQADTLSNQHGQLAAGQTAEINGNHILNQGGQIDAERLQLQAEQVDNSQNGAIRSNQSADLNIVGQLDNRHGQISSADQLHLHDGNGGRLTVSNAAGHILAGRDLQLSARSLLGEGTVAAGRDADVRVNHDLLTEQNIEAGRRLNVAVRGRLTNRHTLQGGESVSVQADAVDNAAGGIIQAGSRTEVQAAQTLENRGLINSNGLTLVRAAQSMQNIGSGRIYGNQLSLASDSLTNREETTNGTTQAATIAARQRLDIGAKNITNQEGALMASQGSMFVGSSLDSQHQAVGEADSLVNNSARIEVAGNARLSAKQGRNLNPHFRTERYVESSTPGQAYSFLGDPNRYVEGVDGHMSQHRTNLRWSYSAEGQRKSGRTEERFDRGEVSKVTRYTYHENVYRERIVENRPGEIIVGGDLALSGDSWFNQHSRILVGGNLAESRVGLLDNQSREEEQVTKQIGDYRQGTYRRNKHHVGQKRVRWQGGGDMNDIIGIRHRPFTHPVGTVEQQAANVPAPQAQADNAAPNPTAVSDAAGRLPQIHSVAADTRLPNGSLFKINPGRAGWLIETDPAFTDYRSWLGSDYMLRGLGQDPDYTHKRLGDGYYEQRLINEQIAKLTGYRRLDGYQNDEQQFKALMDAGITFARSQNLVPGIALSAEQVARLTSDIVWLERQSVSLPDGSTQTLLVPKVYVVARKGDVNTAGALISAEQISLTGLERMLNNGTVAGRRVVDLGAKNIDNDGQIRGGSVRLRAAQDINLTGGSVIAENILQLQAENIRLRSTTAIGGDRQNGNTTVDRVAGLYVTAPEGGILQVQADKRLQADAALISNASANGQTRLLAGEQIRLGTVQTEHHETLGRIDDRRHRHVHQTAEVGTRIQTQGDLTLAAGDRIDARAAEIDSSQGHVRLAAQNGISLTEGRATLNSDESAYNRSSGLLTRRSDQYQARRQHDTAVSGSLTGRQVTVQSNQDLLVRGNNIVSDAGTTLAAGGKIELNAAENHYRNEDTHRARRSGFTFGMRNGVANIGYSQSRSRTTQDNDLTAAVSSRVGSLNGDTVIAAGERIDTQAAQLFAGRDLALQSKEVNLGAAYVQENTRTEYQSSGSGFSLNLNLKAPELRQLQKYGEAFSKTRQQQGNVADKLRTWETHHAAAAFEQWMPAVSSSLTRQKSHSEDTQRYLRAVGSSANAGGTVRIDATQGDANIIGSQVFGHEGLQLTASRDVNILAAGEPLDKHYRGSSRLSGIMPGDSAFSRFIGNKTDRSRQEGSEIIQSGSVVGSGSGDTLIQAGRSYTQTGSRLLADGNIDIRAQNITVQAADSPYRSDYYHSYTQKGLTVAVGTLVTDLMQTAQAAAASAEQVGQSRHDRVNIMAAANSAYQGYQAYQMAANSVRNATAPKAAGNTGSGSNGKSGSKGGPINISITYGEQHNSEHNHVDGNQTTASGIQAQGQVRLTAADAGEQSDIRITGSDVAGERGTYLAAEHNLLLEAAREQRNETRRSRQAGWNAGVALSVGNGLSLGVTGGGNYGRGKGDGESTTYRHSHIGSSRSRTELVSGADTTLHGARVEGKGIGLTARNLNITTPQDSERYRGKQFHGNVQITVGYGFSGNAEYSQSKTDADHLSASEQSGLYAGDDGFQVAVSRHTELNGGLIVSSQSAEQNGRNRFQTGSLGQSDLANHSRYSGKSFGFGMSGGINGKGKQEIGESGNVRWAAQGQSDANGIAQGSSGRFSQGFGFGKEQDSQSSTTRSGIGTRNIQITDAAEQQRRSAQSVQQAAEGIYTDRRTETADATAGYLKNGFDRERVEKELALQQSVTRQFNATVRSVGSNISQKTENYRQLAELADNYKDTAQAQGDLETAAYWEAQADQARSNARNWQRAGVLLNMVAAGLSSPADNAAGIAAATASPAVSYQIGQYFKSHDAEGTPAHLLAHTILGAATAAAGNQNPLAGGLSAGTAEAAAPVISQWLYGKAPNELSAEEKSTLSNITGLLGAGTGALAGGSTENAAVGNLAAKNAVENNSELFDDIREFSSSHFEGWANSARKRYPNTPALSGVIVGGGKVVDGFFGLTDAAIESSVVITCIVGGNVDTGYCPTAIKNSQIRGEDIAGTIDAVGRGAIQDSATDWARRVQNGDRKAVEELASFSFQLGVGGVASKVRTPFTLESTAASVSRAATGFRQIATEYTFAGARQLKGFGQNAANSYRLWRARPFSQFADNARFGAEQVPSPIIRTQPASRPNLNPNGFTASFKPAPKPAATRPPTITFNQPPAASSRWNGAWRNGNWSTYNSNTKPVTVSSLTRPPTITARVPGEPKLNHLNIGRNNSRYNSQLRQNISEHAPGRIFNEQAVRQLQRGVLPGKTTKGQTGIPREMVATPEPNKTAMDFIERFVKSQGVNRMPKPIVEHMNGDPNKPFYRYDLNGGVDNGGTTINYRPSGFSTKSTSTTASVDINNASINQLNLRRNNPMMLKLKFPIKSEVK